MSAFEQLCKNLEAKIQNSYERGTTALEAEHLAAEFLAAQFKVSDALKEASLNSSMRKSGLKAIRAAVYMEAAKATDRKPSDTMLAAIVDMHEVVQQEQESYDTASIESSSLERYYNIFQNAHIFYRNLARGTFGN